MTKTIAIIILCWHRFYGNYLPYFVNLLIDQIITLYLLLPEIICLGDEKFFGMHFGGVTYLLAPEWRFQQNFISLTFATCRPSRAAGPSKVSEIKFLILFDWNVTPGNMEKNYHICIFLVVVLSIWEKKFEADLCCVEFLGRSICTVR